MKAFKTLKTAEKHCPQDANIIRVGDLYIVPECTDEFLEISVLKKQEDKTSWRIVGTVTEHHLIRLGNANWATPEKIS